MGDYNQYLWIKGNLNGVKGPVLEIGSKYYDDGTFVDYRPLFSDKTYIGTDQFSGRNVDVVCDFTADFEKITHKIGYDQVGTIICCSVLEHVPDIFKISRNISNLLEKGGTLFVSVPFVWEYHGYPNDYWRLTPNGVKYLFQEFDFPSDRRTISSNINFDMEELDDDPNNFLMRQAILHRYSQIRNPLIRKAKRIKDLVFDRRFRNEFILKKMFGRELKFPNTSINMIGIKK